jgi:uroporphyrinogen decarboxylase
MRQAGRYLSEYRATRAKANGFIDFCRRSDLAAEATLQPIEILGVDAAIIFSDILVVPLEMGMRVEFAEKVGPVLPDPIKTQDDIDRLANDCADRLEYVYDALKIVRGALAPDKALIGFAGSPWTLATYMIEGGGSKTYATAKKMAYSAPDLLHKLLRKLSDAIGDYLLRQIDAGANAVQIFDSWGGALEKSAFFEFSWHYMKRIAKRVKSERAHIPVILFSKGAGGYLEAIDGDFDVFGVDWNTPIERAKSVLFDRYALQGNMEPARLYSKAAIEAGACDIARVMGKENGYIFNLGHGMQPDFSSENAKFLVDFVHETFAR